MKKSLKSLSVVTKRFVKLLVYFLRHQQIYQSISTSSCWNYRVHNISSWQCRIKKLNHNQSIDKFWSCISNRWQVGGKWTGSNPFIISTCSLWIMDQNTYYTTNWRLNKIIRISMETYVGFSVQVRYQKLSKSREASWKKGKIS